MIPTFNSTRSTAPLGSVTVGELESILRNDPILTQRTEAVRSTTDPGRLKLKLPGVSLGGVFKPLPPTANHGPRCRGRCWPAGYRNTAHIDWTARTGLVLIDLDDVQDPRWVQFYLKHAAPAVSLAWVSARGRGVKVGVLTSPIPLTGQNVDAWGAAYTHIAAVLKAAGMTEGVDFKIDATPAASQLAILAHDPAPLVRRAELALAWTPAPADATRPEWRQTLDPIAPAQTVGELVAQLPWSPGNRSASMFRLGIASATSGLAFEASRTAALAVATGTRLVADYGEYTSLRHFDRGYWQTRERLLDGFGPW